MRIVSCEPFLTELIASLGLFDSLIGVSHRCDSPDGVGERYVVTRPAGGSPASHLFRSEVLWSELKRLAPDVLVLRPPEREQSSEGAAQCAAEAQSFAESRLGFPVKICAHNPRTLSQVFEVFEALAADLGVPDHGRRLHNRVKAQMMNWVDNFYQRMKSKRVTLLSSVEPLGLAGFWVPDMIRLASAVSQAPSDGMGSRQTDWAEIVRFRPDVILVAPEGVALPQARGAFKVMEKLPGWEDVPAVKRGEVYFTGGLHNFYRPSARLMDSMAILISAVAGFEAGYITERDSFYKLRWLEMQRHRI